MTQSERVPLVEIPPQERPVRAQPRELRKLAKDIEQNGMIQPIIMIDELVIDGLKRVEAARLLKWDSIPVFENEDWGAVCLELERLREGRRGEDNQGRSIDLVESLLPGMVKWMNMRRRHFNANRTKYEGPGAEFDTRKLLSMATGLHEGRVEVILKALRDAKDDPTTASRLQDARSGAISLYTLHGFMRRKRNQDNIPVATATEIRTVVENGFRALDTTFAQMEKFGAAAPLTRAERVDFMAGLNEYRRRIALLVTTIRNGIEDEA